MVTLQKKSRREEEEDKVGEYESSKVNLAFNGNVQPPAVKLVPASSSFLPAINDEEEV